MGCGFGFGCVFSTWVFGGAKCSSQSLFRVGLNKFEQSRFGLDPNSTHAPLAIGYRVV